jgi:WD40 repeat protein
VAALPERGGGINVLDFSPDGRRLASAGSDGAATIWDATGCRELARLDDGEPRGPLIGLTFSPDGRLLATAGLKARAVHLWDPNTGEPRGTLPASDLGAIAIAFSPAGDLLAIAQGDGTLVLWDPAARRVTGRVRAQGREFLTAAFSGDGRLLATGGRDGRVRLWDVGLVLGRDRPGAGG